jgi:hypothetical protein
MQNHYRKSTGAWLAGGLIAAFALPAALAQNAAGLKDGSLTPYGAERAGNKDKTIPAWDGKLVATPLDASFKRPDPFAGEKPRLTINAANVAQYGDKLSEGTKAMLAKNPNFRLEVYPTHRPAVFSQAIYDNVLRNAASAKVINDGQTVVGAYGGIPFPVPKTGDEALWNHRISYRGQLTTFTSDKYVMTSAGDRVLTNRQRTTLVYPYYDLKAKPDGFEGQWSRARIEVTEPPANAGQALLTVEYVDNFGKPKDSWQYLPGQRRVRKSPSVAYDTPDASTAGIANFDDVNLFNGEGDRYNVKLVGKREMYVPYNNNGMFIKPIASVIGKGALNPDAVRWELHRVWEIELTLRPGKRNVAAKRRLYLDEDTWQAVLSDTWDAQGKLWKTGQAFTLVAGDESSASTLSYALFDLTSGSWVLAAAVNETGGVNYQDYDTRQLTRFAPGSLASGGVR